MSRTSAACSSRSGTIRACSDGDTAFIPPDYHGCQVGDLGCPIVAEVAHVRHSLYFQVETPKGRPPFGGSRISISSARCSAIRPGQWRASPGGLMLTVRSLRVSYGGAILALRQISVEVPRGAVVAVLGSNGAGKTTLLRAISGVLGEHGGAVDAGSIEFEGRSLVGRSPAAIVTAGIVQAPEGRRIFERLTVAENLRIGG